MPDLERALQIAVKAHAGQKDKNGAPYIFHPIRVMTRCTSDNGKIVALLHDVIEDTPITIDQLQAEGFGPPVLAALRLLTHEASVPYEEYVEQLMVDRIAVEVKIADLEDNSDIRRLKTVDDKTLARLRKYATAYLRLTERRTPLP